MTEAEERKIGLAEVHFIVIWKYLARRGRVDVSGGREWQRVRTWWRAEGRPRPIARFILKWANWTPGDPLPPSQGRARHAE